jgi:hypothetical protein
VHGIVVVVGVRIDHLAGLHVEDLNTGLFLCRRKSNP